MADVFSLAVLDRAKLVLSEHGKELKELQHFVVCCTPQHAAEVAKVLGAELNLDGQGNQLIDRQLIVTRPKLFTQATTQNNTIAKPQRSNQ